jgi:hypothetical protein
MRRLCNNAKQKSPENRGVAEGETLQIGLELASVWAPDKGREYCPRDREILP